MVVLTSVPDEQKDTTNRWDEEMVPPWRPLAIVACVEEKAGYAHVFVKGVAREF